MYDETSNSNSNTMSESNTIPTWFKIIAWLAFVWNLMGVMAFVGHMMITPEIIAALPEAEQKLYESTPTWATVAFALAVLGGALGTLVLALKKAISFPILVISLIGVLVQMYHSFFVIDSLAVYGPGQAIMPSLVILIAIGLVWLSNDAKNKGWIS